MKQLYFLKRNSIYILTFIFLLFFVNIFSSNIFSKEDIEIYSNKAISMDFESSNVLYSKNAFEKVYPASTTKILTAIIAIESLELDTKIVVSKNAFYSTPYGSSVMRVTPGEIFSVNELLHGLLLLSGNDAANVIAESVSGNIPEFVNLMNLKLKEIGCKDSNFTNPHGFHDDNHYSTPYDMALIMRYAMSNNTFRKICETKTFEISPNNLTSETKKITNTNKLTNEEYPSMYYQYALGGKTGYTIEARGTFVGYGKKDDKTVIVGTFDGPQKITGSEARFLDSKKLLDYSFDNFSRNKILDKNDYRFSIIDKENNQQYALELKEDIYGLTKSNEHTSNYNIDFNSILSNIRQNTNEDTNLINITVKGNNLYMQDTYNLTFTNKNLTTSNFESKQIFIYLQIFIILVLLILILFYIITSMKNRNISIINKEEFKDSIGQNKDRSDLDRNDNSL